VSVASELKPPAAKRTGLGMRFYNQFLANARGGLALLGRAPHGAVPRGVVPCGVLPRPAWRRPGRLVLGGLVAVAVIVASMVLIDARAILAVGSLPLSVIDLFNKLTDYGTSDWFLVPIGLVLAAVAALAGPALTHMSRLVLAAFAVRLGFVFAAIALPGLFVTIVKRLIGRARPFVGGEADPFLYVPFSWRPEYASLPSGHATNVFAALVAVGLVCPRLRPIMLLYALTIGASRVIVLAHHPSDVIAGAIAGSLGALLVRDWFAARRLGFVIDRDGQVKALPGPSRRRLMTVARQLVGP
jgi:membrane-associated phospholipid phosphatase